MASRSPGFSFEHVLECQNAHRVLDEPLLIFPRAETQIEVRTQSPKRIWPIDAGSVFLVPRGLPFEIECTSEDCDFLRLHVSEEMINRVSKQIGINPDLVTDLKQSCAKILRSRFLDSRIDEFMERLDSLEEEASDERNRLAHQIL